MKEQKFSESKKRLILLNFTKELIKNSGDKEFFRLENVLKKEARGSETEEPLDFEEVFKEQSRHSEKRKLSNLENFPLPQPVASEEKKFSEFKNMPGQKPVIPKEKEKGFAAREKLTRTIEIDENQKPEESLVNVLRSGRSKRPLVPPSLRRGKLPFLKIPKQTLPSRFGYLKPIPTKRELDLGPLNALVKDPLVKNIECNGAGKNIIVEGTMGRKETNINLDRQEIDEIIEKFSKAAKIPVSEGVFRVAFGRFIFSAIISDVISSKFIIKKIVYTPEFQ